MDLCAPLPKRSGKANPATASCDSEGIRGVGVEPCSTSPAAVSPASEPKTATTRLRTKTTDPASRRRRSLHTPVRTRSTSGGRTKTDAGQPGGALGDASGGLGSNAGQPPPRAPGPTTLQEGAIARAQLRVDAAMAREQQYEDSFEAANGAGWDTCKGDDKADRPDPRQRRGTPTQGGARRLEPGRQQDLPGPHARDAGGRGLQAAPRARTADGQCCGGGSSGGGGSSSSSGAGDRAVR